MKKAEIREFVGLMEDYLHIPSSICEVMEDKLLHKKYPEVIGYIVSRRKYYQDEQLRKGLEDCLDTPEEIALVKQIIADYDRKDLEKLYLISILGQAKLEERLNKISKRLDDRMGEFWNEYGDIPEFYCELKRMIAGEENE